MKIIKLIHFFAIAALLTACVSAPPLAKPLQLTFNEGYQLYRAPVLDQTGHVLQHLNQDKNIVYFQTFGGGGAGVGLLLGPLGVLANIKAIESNTMKDVGLLKDKIAISPNDLFLSSATKSGMQPQSSTASLKLNPYVLIEKTEGEVIMLASAILVENLNSPNKTPNKYMIQLPVTYTLAELSVMDAEKTKALQMMVEDGFSILIARMKAEPSANVEMEEKITMVSEFLVPRFKLEMAGSLIEKTSDYSWVRTASGVFGVKNSDITIKKAKR